MRAVEVTAVATADCAPCPCYLFLITLRGCVMLGDPLFWIFVLPGLLLGMYAQGRIKANVAKYSQVGTLRAAKVVPCKHEIASLKDMAA